MTRPRLRPVPTPGADRPGEPPVPPHNLEAEQAVLGAILAAGRLLVEVAGQVEETDFYRPAHRVVWRAINALADRGEPTDPITVLLGAAGALPAFPVEVLPTWVGQYVTAVATATQPRLILAACSP